MTKKVSKANTANTTNTGNRGEWSEPYAAIRILGDGKLYIADQNGNKNINEWMRVLELIRHETQTRIVTYRCKEDELLIDIDVNGKKVISVPADEFLRAADRMLPEIKAAKGKTFTLSETVTDFLDKIEIQNRKGASGDKSDIYLTLNDPRASITRKHIGFSIKSGFGKDPTLFNTAPASAAVYKLTGMTDSLMEEINGMFDKKGKAAVLQRCDTLRGNGCTLDFVGFAVAPRAKVRTFEENLDLIDSRLLRVIDYVLKNHFFEHETETDLTGVVKNIISANPCGISRPEVKYPYMLKSLLYASYCGMTASHLWNGDSQVNGGFIKVNKDGQVLAYYALESDSFKSYLFNSCYFEFPGTSKKHGEYGKVYKEGGEYYFRLNFQIRYKC
jgi:uncharacterized protein YuzE